MSVVLVPLGLSWPLCALVTVLLGVVCYGFHPLRRWRVRHLPGPPPRWLVGNLPEIARGGIQEAHARWARRYGPGPCVYWMGAIPFVLTDNPEHARKVMARPARPPAPSLQVGDEARFDSYSMVFTSGEMWRAGRTAWQPFFKTESLHKCAPLMTACAGRLCEQLGRAADEGREVDMWRALGEMTLDVVGTTALGVDLSAAGGSEGRESGGQPGGGTASRLIAALRTYFQLFGFGSPLLIWSFLVPEAAPLICWWTNAFPSQAFKQDLAARAEIRHVSADLIRRELAHQAEAASTAAAAGSAAEGAAADGTEAAAGARKRPGVVDPGSFLALVLPSMGQKLDGTAGQVLGVEWAANQAGTFIKAGYETTANALSFAVHLLSSNPDKEARLLQEIDAFGRHRQPSAADLEPSFPYACAVGKEALRLFPPFVFTTRQAKSGAALGGVPLPDRVPVVVSVYSMHRNSRWWADPEAFQPERFLPGGAPQAEEAAAANVGAWMPFGDGPRMCIGYRFALQEMALALITLYQQFTFRLLPGQVPLKLRVALAASPVGGVRVTVHRR